MKRSTDPLVESNKRARVESKHQDANPVDESTNILINQLSSLSNESTCQANSQSINPAIKQSSQLSKLFYPFLLPLVVKFLQLRSVLQLLLVCKDVRPFVNNFPVRKCFNQEEADQLIDPSRYVTFRIFSIRKATSPDLSMHPFLNYLEFDDEFNTPIEPGHLPSNLSIVIFPHNSKFNQHMKPGTFPASVQNLLLPSKWNQTIEPGLFLEMRSLNLSREFNHPLVPGCFSSKLTSLKFGTKFNQPLRAGVLPPNLEDLILMISISLFFLTLCH